MSDELMSIRVMCELFDVTPRTLRFYEQKELLFPHRDGQKRLFTRRDRARLKLILRGKRFGISLEEIRQILDLYDMEDQRDAQLTRSLVIARRRLAELNQQREEIERSIAELAELIAQGEKLQTEQDRQSAA